MPGCCAPDQVAEITGIRILQRAFNGKLHSGRCLIARLMIKKGRIIKNEFFDMLEERQKEFKAKSND